VASGVTDGGEGGRAGKMPPGSSDMGPFSKMAPFCFLCIQNNFINFKRLVHTNLFLASAVSCKALRKQRRRHGWDWGNSPPTHYKDYFCKSMRKNWGQGRWRHQPNWNST